MAHNNDALYDAVVAGAGGGAQHGWLVLTTPASYTPFATNIDVLATAVDLQIPTIAGGASISQINLLQSITHSVLTARYPVATVPATYVDIAKAIAAVYIELEKLLTNQPTVASYGVNWLVTDWYIDGTVGDDANSGVVIGAPIKTGAELLRRLGPYAMWPQSVTVHVLANGMADALILHGAMLVAGTHLDVVGTPTLVADAGTVATYLALNPATPTATQLTTTAIVDWTPYQWKRLRLTSGANIGAVAWIAKSNPAGIGIATARISVFYRISLTSVNTLPITVTPVVGESLVIESLPVVPALDIQVDGMIFRGNVPAFAVRTFYTEGISVPMMSLSTKSMVAGARCTIFGCEVGCQYLPVAQIDPGGLNFCNISCLFGYADPGIFAIGYYNTLQIAIGGLVGKEVLRVEIMAANAYLFQTLFQGARAVVQTQCTAKLSAIQIFDVASATASGLIISGRAWVSSLSGANNAGWGLSLENNCSFKYNGTINLQGLLSNGKFQTAPNTLLTLPQLLQYSDYAQKGITPAMVAGTTTVTVPWYDNATQQVTVSHAAFAGTPGILSVQQISNTQFTITSSSALDTSTIRWQISPLGRNIFITNS
jgi:hypothetical protein